MTILKCDITYDCKNNRDGICTRDVVRIYSTAWEGNHCENYETSRRYMSDFSEEDEP